VTNLKTICSLLALTMLAACGAYAPPAPTRSAIEQRQTALALQGSTPLAPLNGESAEQPLPTAAPLVIEIPADDPRALGNPAALVTIVEFSDFE
jgi:protein-disulfide isomerase